MRKTRFSVSSVKQTWPPSSNQLGNSGEETGNQKLEKENLDPGTRKQEPGNWDERMTVRSSATVYYAMTRPLSCTPRLL